MQSADKKFSHSPVVARQNVPITSNLTDFTLASLKDFDVALSPIGSKEMRKF